MSDNLTVKEVLESMKSLASACELLGQERALLAVMDHLEVRGADEAELAIFDKAVRERIKYSNENR